ARAARLPRVPGIPAQPGPSARVALVHRRHARRARAPLSAPVGPGGKFRRADTHSASFLAALARTSPDLIAVIDDVGRLKYASAAATAMLGYGVDELIGTSTFELVHPVDQIGALEGFASTMSTADSRPDPLLIRLRHADGSWLQTEI